MTDRPAAPPELLADPAPWVRGFRCESCGSEPGVTVFVPNGLGGGRRICRDCLRVVDTLRAGRGLSES
jgi:hypothetical protein